MTRSGWEDLPKTLKLRRGLRIDQTVDMGTVEVIYSEEEASCDYVHPNLVLYRAVRTGEVIGCRLRLNAPADKTATAPRPTTTLDRDVVAHHGAVIENVKVKPGGCQLGESGLGGSEWTSARCGFCGMGQSPLTLAGPIGESDADIWVCDPCRKLSERLHPHGADEQGDTLLQENCAKPRVQGGAGFDVKVCHKCSVLPDLRLHRKGHGERFYLRCKKCGDAGSMKRTPNLAVESWNGDQGWAASNWSKG